jgi:hypothetical protein
LSSLDHFSIRCEIPLHLAGRWGFETTSKHIGGGQRKPFLIKKLTVAIIVHLQEHNFADKKKDRSDIFRHHPSGFRFDRQRFSC